MVNSEAPGATISAVRDGADGHSFLRSKFLAGVVVSQELVPVGLFEEFGGGFRIVRQEIAVELGEIVQVRVWKMEGNSIRSGHTRPVFFRDHC